MMLFEHFTDLHLYLNFIRSFSIHHCLELVLILLVDSLAKITADLSMTLLRIKNLNWKVWLELTSQKLFLLVIVLSTIAQLHLPLIPTLLFYFSLVYLFLEQLIAKINLNCSSSQTSSNLQLYLFQNFLSHSYSAVVAMPS